MKKFKFMLAVSFLALVNVISIGEIKAEDQFHVQQQVKIAELEEQMGEEIEMEVMSNDEIDYVNQQSNNIESVSNLKEEIMNEGFEKVEVTNDKTSYKYTVVGTEHTVYMTSEVYESNDEMIVTFAQYNKYNDDISVYYAEKRSTIDVNQDPESLIEYSNPGEVENDGNMIESQSSFTWNGQEFACNMTGLFACGQVCGVWAVVNPIAGGTCTAVCGTAFGVACMQA